MPIEHNLDCMSASEHASGLAVSNFLQDHHFGADLSVTENAAYAEFPEYLPDSPSTRPATAFSLTSSCSPQSIPDTPTSEVAPKKSGKKKRPGHIPRPCNAFFIFRSDFVREHARLDGGRQQNLSKLAAIAWRMISPETKDIYEAKAVTAREIHRLRFPGYTYMPDTHNAGGRKRKVTQKAAVAESTLNSTSPTPSDSLQMPVENDEVMSLPIDSSYLSVTDLPPALDFTQPFSLGVPYIDPFVGPSSLPLFPHELQFSMPSESFYLTPFYDNYTVPSIDSQIETTSYETSFPSSDFDEYYFY